MVYQTYQAHYYLHLQHFGFNDHAMNFLEKSKYFHFLMNLVNIQV